MGKNPNYPKICEENIFILNFHGHPKSVDQNLPDFFSAVCVGDQLQSASDLINTTIFVGFHLKNQLLCVMLVLKVLKLKVHMTYFNLVEFLLRNY